MSKEYLEAFNRITLHTEYDNDGSYDCLNFEDDCKLVDEALTRLESIDNAKPSEALELLDHIVHSNNLEWMPETIREGVKRDLGIVQQALIKAQEQEKVLEIIKKKDVDLRTLKTCFKVECGLQEYNRHQRKENELTQDEYNLLKEVIKSERGRFI